jgi:hypothetical protein
MKKLKLWNGSFGRNQHAYICANSRAHASLIYCQADHKIRGINKDIDKFSLDRANRDIRDYFHEGRWGIMMDGITPEIGFWLQKDKLSKPERIL